MLAVPGGLPAGTPLARLTAYDKTSRVLHNTHYSISTTEAGLALSMSFYQRRVERTHFREAAIWTLLDQGRAGTRDSGHQQGAAIRSQAQDKSPGRERRPPFSQRNTFPSSCRRREVSLLKRVSIFCCVINICILCIKLLPFLFVFPLESPRQSPMSLHLDIPDHLLISLLKKVILPS